MSSRDLHYYEDFRHPVNGHRKRFWWRSGIDGTRPMGDVPEWGGAGTDDWKRLPNGFLKGTSSGAFGYDALPMGLFDPPTKQFVLDLQLLYASGDSDHANVAKYITEGRGPTTTFYRASPIYDEGREIDTRNLYAILTDKGDSSLAIEDFYVEYIGGQDISLEETLKVSTVAGVVVQILYTAKTLNLARVCLGEMLPGDLYQVARFNHLVLGAGYPYEVESWIYGNANHTTTWDLTYIHAYGNPPINWSDHERQNFWIHETSMIWGVIETLATTILVLLTGLEDATWSWGYKTGFTTGLGPMTMLRLAGHVLEGTSSQSDLTDTSGSYGPQDRFCGLIDRRDNSELIGGWFHPGEPDGVHRFDTIWEMLQTATEACGARARITMDQFGSTVVTFESLQHTESKAVGTILGRGDPTMRKGILGGADGDVIEGVGVDYTVWGTKEANRRTIPMFFTAGPQVGSEGDIDAQEISSDAGFDVISGKVVGVYQIHFPVNLLIRYQQPTNASRPVPMVAHSNVGIRRKTAADITADCLDDAGALPEPYLTITQLERLQSSRYLDADEFPESRETHADGDTNPYDGANTFLPMVNDYWWRPYRKVRLKQAKQGGIPYAVAVLTTTVFSKWHQYGIPLTLDYSDAMLEDLGATLGITPSDHIPMLAAMADYADEPYIVSGTVDDGAGTVSVETIGLGE